MCNYSRRCNTKALRCNTIVLIITDDIFLLANMSEYVPPSWMNTDNFRLIKWGKFLLKRFFMITYSIIFVSQSFDPTRSAVFASIRFPDQIGSNSIDSMKRYYTPKMSSKLLSCC